MRDDAGSPWSGNRQQRPRGPAARTVGSFVAKIARPAFEANGFPSSALLTDWPAIAGADLAAFTQPERLAWPRRQLEADDDAGGGPRLDRNATLYLRVDGPRALEVQHCVPQLIERINTYFGYGALGRIRIVQGPVKRTSPGPREAPPHIAQPETRDYDAIDNEGLRHALRRLASQIPPRETR